MMDARIQLVVDGRRRPETERNGQIRMDPSAPTRRMPLPPSPNAGPHARAHQATTQAESTHRTRQQKVTNQRAAQTSGKRSIPHGPRHNIAVASPSAAATQRTQRRKRQRKGGGDSAKERKRFVAILTPLPVFPIRSSPFCPHKQQCSSSIRSHKHRLLLVDACFLFVWVA